jgi:hypothetical protein
MSSTRSLVKSKIWQMKKWTLQKSLIASVGDANGEFWFTT